MDRYGLRGVTLSWFSSYLEDRKIRAKCRTTHSGKIVKSDTYSIEYGTPKDPVLDL